MKNNTARDEQNSKIRFITDDMMIVGVDVGSVNHYARAFTNRGIELSRKAYHLTNSSEGFEAFKAWAAGIAKQNGMKFILVGMEPTGHYWINLGKYVTNNGMILAQVNPAAVHKSKELDDNNPSKNDKKDPKVIAGLVKDGRYTMPYMPEGLYAEIRELSNQRSRVAEEMTRVKNRLARWFAIYFPEYLGAFNDTRNISGSLALEECPLPADIVKIGVDGILKIWRSHKLRGAGRRRAEKLYNAAKISIGRTEAADAARMEIHDLLEDLKTCEDRLARIMEEVDKKLWEVPNAKELLKIEGVGVVSVLTFVAEVGDISRIKDAKALQKLAGFAIVADSSGKHNGASRISYRGRKRLRHAMYNLAISLICHNGEFRAIHQYYTTREQNPLKKLQSVIAVACKAMRVFYKIMTSGIAYDGQKMIADIIRPEAA